MCVVSMIADHYTNKWKPLYFDNPGPQVTREEFDDLRKRVDEMIELLKKAKAYDARTGQPDCERADKLAVVRAVAKAVGVDLDEALRAR